MPRIVSATAIEDHRLELVFDDETHGIVDLRPVVGRGPASEPLADPEFFAKVSVNPEWGCVEWPNGYDLCPDALYA